MNNSIFRKESLDRVSAPEQLNKYIRTTRPAVWLVLAAIAVLLVGFLVFACFAEVDGVKLISFLLN